MHKFKTGVGLEAAPVFSPGSSDFWDFLADVPAGIADKQKGAGFETRA
jgi:hypothetical protein